MQRDVIFDCFDANKIMIILPLVGFGRLLVSWSRLCPPGFGALSNLARTSQCRIPSGSRTRRASARSSRKRLNKARWPPSWPWLSRRSCWGRWSLPIGLPCAPLGWIKGGIPRTDQIWSHIGVLELQILEFWQFFTKLFPGVDIFFCSLETEGGAP